MGRSTYLVERAQLLRAESLALLDAVDDPSLNFGDDEEREDIRAALRRSIQGCERIIQCHQAENAPIWLADEGEGEVAR